MNINDMINALPERPVLADLRELHDAFMDAGQTQIAFQLKRIIDAKRPWTTLKVRRGFLFRLGLKPDTLTIDENGIPHGFAAGRTAPCDAEYVMNKEEWDTTYIVNSKTPTLTCVEGWRLMRWQPKRGAIYRDGLRKFIVLNHQETADDPAVSLTAYV